ncbi:MAG: prepilin-type N-terminal cleavage/methylation domain-containing protein [Patescibacteria group bacterium]|nr:prepilin-type N-terminal cleavage/methylation domain-containing protein [Patescibacteria group bacterium]
MKRGFTLIEVIISMVVLGVIIAAMSAIYAVSLREFKIEKNRNEMQRSINFASDELGKNIKQAINIPENYDTYTRGPETLITELPSIDSDEEYLYNGSDLRTDYIIYYLSGSELHKITLADPLSSRQEVSGSDIIILSNVTNFSCDYDPDVETDVVSCDIALSQNIYNKDITVNATKTAIKRNQE